MSSWLFLLILCGLMAMIGAGTIRSGLMLRDTTPRSNLLLSWPDNLLRLGLALACLALGLTLGPGPSALYSGTGSAAGDILLGGLCGLALAGMLSLAGLLAARRWGESIYSTRMVRCILPANRGEWFGVIPALFLAAALEEMLFRWLPLAGLTWLITPWWLLWPLALFFGFLHWPQGWWGVAGTTLAAVALSLLFLVTGSIWPPLIAHYTLNVLELVLASMTGLEPLRAG